MPKKDRHRQWLDTEPNFRQRIKELAHELRVPESQIWNLFAGEGLQRVKDGTSSIWERLRPGKGLHYKNIDYDDLMDD